MEAVAAGVVLVRYWIVPMYTPSPDWLRVGNPFTLYRAEGVVLFDHASVSNRTSCIPVVALRL